jgi:hypothetical protein
MKLSVDVTDGKKTLSRWRSQVSSVRIVGIVAWCDNFRKLKVIVQAASSASPQS